MLALEVGPRRVDPAVQQPIAHRERQREVLIVPGRDRGELGELEVQLAQKIAAQRGGVVVGAHLVVALEHAGERSASPDAGADAGARRAGRTAGDPAGPVRLGRRQLRPESRGAPGVASRFTHRRPATAAATGRLQAFKGQPHEIRVIDLAV